MRKQREEDDFLQDDLQAVSNVQWNIALVLTVTRVIKVMKGLEDMRLQKRRHASLDRFKLLYKQKLFIS